MKYLRILYFNTLIRLSRVCAQLLRLLNKDTHETFMLLRPFRWALGNLHRDEIVFKTKGVKFLYQNKELINLKIALVGAHEYEITEFFLNNLRESYNFLDVGANIGYYTLIAAKRLNRGQVIAIEPSEINFCALEKNIKLNNLTNILVIRKIAWRESGQELAMRIQNPFNLGSIKVAGDGAIECRARTISIDDLVRKLRLRRADVVKIDVEGAEYEVLLGMRNCLREYRPKYIVCAMDNPDESIRRRSYELLLFQGYTEVDFVNQEPIKREVATMGNYLFKAVYPFPTLAF